MARVLLSSPKTGTFNPPNLYPNLAALGLQHAPRIPGFPRPHTPRSILRARTILVRAAVFTVHQPTPTCSGWSSTRLADKVFGGIARQDLSIVYLCIREQHVTPFSSIGECSLESQS